jgi:hypothetical protein
MPHEASQPTVISGGANRAFVSGLNIFDRSYSDKLVQKYGNEKYSQVLEMLGLKVKTENRDFYHYERRRRHASVKVASLSGGGSPGVNALVTVSSENHYDSGSKSPGRLGEVVQAGVTGILGKITAINVTTPNAHVYTIAPLRSTERFNPGAGDFLFFHGLQHIGEASTAQTAMQPLVDKITNSITEIREDYDITDKAAMEKIEWRDPDSGMTYYKYYGTSEAEARWLNNRELLAMFSVDVTNTGITSNGTVGTKGILDQVRAAGATLQYTPGSLAIFDWQRVSREMDFNGASAEAHVLSDTFQNQELNRSLFSAFDDGAVLWGSAGGSKEVAAKLGFSSFAIDGVTFHFKKYYGFTPEKMYGVAPTLTTAYRNYGLIIPQGYGTDPMTAQKLPTICLRYQEIKPGMEMNVYEYGGLAETNKTPEQKLSNVIVGHYGVQVQAANQCVIFQGQ